MVVLPLELKYRADLRNVIAEALLQSENSLTYSKLYERAVEKLEFTLSHRDYAYCLRVMVKDGLIVKEDKVGTRGQMVFYRLTQSAMTQNQLRILKIDADYVKKRSIYQILLYFESFQRGQMVSHRQLVYKLSRLGLGLEDLKEVTDKDTKELNGVTFDFIRGSFTVIGSFTIHAKSIEIMKLIRNVYDRNTVRNKVMYYIFIPGFTTEEFKSYLKNLSKSREPRPFSKNPPLIPYVYYIQYKDAEIEEAIELLYKARLIKLSRPVFRDEIRYHVSDDSSVGFVNMVRKIQELDIHKIMAKMTYFEQPDEDDKRSLILFFGKKVVDFLISRAHQIRKDLQKNNSHQVQIEIKKMKRMIQWFKSQIQYLVRSIDILYNSHFSSNELLVDLITGFARYPV